MKAAMDEHGAALLDDLEWLEALARPSLRAKEPPHGLAPVDRPTLVGKAVDALPCDVLGHGVQDALEVAGVVGLDALADAIGRESAH